MSSLNILLQNAHQFFLNCKESLEDDELNRPTEFFAAVRLQAAYRGYVIRRTLKKLTENVVKIQSVWRGYKAKEIYRQKLLESVQEMNQGFYNRAAIMIQKHWRGYYSRKLKGDFYKRKQYLDGVREASLRLNSEIARSEFKSKDSITSLTDFKQKKLLLENWVIKNHHLISTHTQPGAYRTKGYEEVDGVLLSSVNFLKLSQMGSYERKSQICKSLKENLQKKFQGPFRSAVDVAYQRRKALSPSLRVMTDFYSTKNASESDRLQDCVLRLNDESFVFGKPRSPAYKKLITADGNYNTPDYGRTHFRSAIDSDKNDKKISNAFKTTLPPIPLFSRFGREYCPRYVVL